MNTGADARPRVHIWPQPNGHFHWSIGATGMREHPASNTVGAAVDGALSHLNKRRGVVVIVEPPT